MVALRLIQSEPVEQLKKPIVLDDIFFHKTQLHVGTRLSYYGRNDSMSSWDIIEIKSHFLGNTVGQYRIRKVEEVRHLSDIVEVRNIHTGQRRKMSFSYMSYSAIWRLAR